MLAVEGETRSSFHRALNKVIQKRMAGLMVIEAVSCFDFQREERAQEWVRDSRDFSDANMKK